MSIVFRNLNPPGGDTPGESRRIMKTKLQARYEAARRSMDRAGYKVSAGSWIDETIGKYYVCSVKSGQGGIYGHPLHEISGNDKSEWAFGRIG